MSKTAPPQHSMQMGAVCHTTLSLCALPSALLFSHQSTTAALICCPQYYPFSAEMLPTQPFPDTHFDSSSTFCFGLVLFKHQSGLSRLFLPFVKIFESFSCSLRALAAPLSLVLSADAISLLHIPLPKSLMKILSNTRPCTDPCSTILNPSFHFDNKQLVAFQYAFPAGLVPYSISPQPDSPTLPPGSP